MTFMYPEKKIMQDYISWYLEFLHTNPGKTELDVGFTLCIQPHKNHRV